MLRQLAILTTMWPLTLAWNKMCHSFLWNLLRLKNLNKNRLSNTLTKAHVIIALLFLFFLFFLLLLLFGLLSTATSTTSSRCSNSSRSSWSNVADQSTKILTWKGVVITSSPSQHTQTETLSPCGSSKYKQTLQGEGELQIWLHWRGGLYIEVESQCTSTQVTMCDKAKTRLRCFSVVHFTCFIDPDAKLDYWYLDMYTASTAVSGESLLAIFGKWMTVIVSTGLPSALTKQHIIISHHYLHQQGQTCMLTI